MQTNSSLDNWILTVASTDATGYVFSFDWTQSDVFTNQQLSFFISDGVNTKSTLIVTNGPLIWKTFNIAEGNMIEDGAGVTDVTAITEIGFSVTLRQQNEFAYADNLSFQVSPGSIDLKLYDMGDTLPKNGTAKLSDGTQYTTIGDLGISGLQQSFNRVSLKSGTRLYHCDGFIAGTAKEIPGNVTLTKNNYYALTINYVDTDTNVFGSDPSFNINFYENGYGFNAADENTAILSPSDYSDIMFIIFSAIDAHVFKASFRFNSEPGDSSELTMYNEDINMKMESVFISHEHSPKQEEVIDSSNSPALITDGGKFELYYSDDPSDSVTEVIMEIEIVYVDPVKNG
jgi:hypothetical protein